MTIGQILKKINKPKKRLGEINWGARILQNQKKDKEALAERAKQAETQKETREKFRNIYCK
jgi:hypothetical protein